MYIWSFVFESWFFITVRCQNDSAIVNSKKERASLVEDFDLWLFFVNFKILLLINVKVTPYTTLKYTHVECERECKNKEREWEFRRKKRGRENKKKVNTHFYDYWIKKNLVQKRRKRSSSHHVQLQPQPDGATDAGSGQWRLHDAQDTGNPQLVDGHDEPARVLVPGCGGTCKYRHHLHLNKHHHHQQQQLSVTGEPRDRLMVDNWTRCPPPWVIARRRDCNWISLTNERTSPSLIRPRVPRIETVFGPTPLLPVVQLFFIESH